MDLDLYDMYRLTPHIAEKSIRALAEIGKTLHPHKLNYHCADKKVSCLFFI